MPAHRNRKLPIVALVGRANVGKSTLWNRMTETGRAIVSSKPHTTRDRNYGRILWRGQYIEAVDTGGLDVGSGDAIARGMIEQVELALKDADIVLFLIDSRDGVMPQDEAAAKTLKHLKKPVLVVANKQEDIKYYGDAFSQEILALGFGNAIPCSASTGRGVGDLLDRVYVELEKKNKPPVPADDVNELKLVVMGRANVGKSSIVNAILGEERVITSPIAHTTREPVDTHFVWKDQPVTLIDTAGMRKRSHLEKGVETESLERNREALRKADIAILVLDATEDARRQDKHLAGLMEDETKGLILVANKWDLVKDKKESSTREYEAEIRSSFPFLKWAPIIFVSAKDKLRTDKILDLAFTIREERRRQIAYNALQKLLKTVVAKKKPLAELGNYSPYIHDVAQVGIEPPTFVITIKGGKQTVHINWVRYFEARLRDKFGYVGTPIVVKVEHAAMPQIQQQEAEHGGKKRPQRRKRPIGRKGLY
ncbi:MAG: ribosome biogenesis GTPase Der [Patescibacteria group bacterium]